MASSGLNELLVSQWHPTKNYPLLPSDVTYGSSQRRWWQCSLGHEWEASPNARSSNSKNANGCPVCANQKVLKGYNDLETLFPAIAEEWHPTLNGDLLPSHVASKSSKKVWWQGKQCGHEWQATIANRVSANSGCPFCAGKKVLVGYNDLASKYPHIAKEWHPTKNSMGPSSVTAGSSKKVWWIGNCNHEWEDTVKNRVAGVRCPACPKYRIYKGRKDRKPKSLKVLTVRSKDARFYTAIKGFNDLATLRPTFVPQWHPTKNGTLSPDTVYAYSSKRFWWQCDKGHEWERSLQDKRRAKNDCPFCKNKRVLVGYNDLATTHPELSLQWHPTKNGALLPTDISYGSSKPVWWICSKEHEWQVAPTHRVSYSTECPDCAVHIFVSKPEKEIAQMLLDNGLAIIQSDRRTVKNHELDIYIPSKKTAIEYNGLYWHSEKADRGQDYHYEKWLAAKNAGIQLIQIWEDDWKRNPEQVKIMLLHKLGLNNQEKVFARNTKTILLPETDAESFLNASHIEGFASGSIYLGLVEGDTTNLVAVLVLNEEGHNTLDIVRYATSKPVVGGFSKLLAYAERTFAPEKFVAFTDHCVSDGGLYEKNGFNARDEVMPDYRYVIKKKQRKDKSEYTVKRFREDPSLKWEDGLTENELANLNNIWRIWDAGRTRWVRTVR